MTQFELQQRWNPVFFPWLSDNAWKTISLHPNENAAILSLLDHEERNTTHVFRVIPQQKDQHAQQ